MLRAFTVLSLAGATAAASLMFESTSASGSAPPAQVAARALAAAPGLDRRSSVGYADGPQARSQAARDGEYVPLPVGGNFNGIRWEELGAGLSAAQVETVVEYNAFCQWLRATSRDDASDALAVLDAVPQWPAFRDQPDLELLRQIVAEAHAGSGPALGAAMSDCVLSHAREVTYAASLGLQASD
jgi:hypothetical protein